MAADAGFVVLLAAAAGLALTVFVERLLLPRPPASRPWQAWALHAALWCIPYSVLVLLMGRPFFAAAGVLAFFLMLVLVNNAKMKALREPFIYQDYEYFLEALRYPRLYIPFMGWGKFLAAALGFALALCIGLWGEVVPERRFSWPGQVWGILAVLGAGLSALFFATRNPLPVAFDPARDLRRLGLCASLWRYASEERAFPAVASPFVSAAHGGPAASLPHLIAVQSESFFDPRPLYAGIRPEVLAGFDLLKADSLASGRLAVPAWGANTVRTEFAFLSGLDGESLGVHRFNPYRSMAKGWQAPGLAAFLKRLGYRTICIHPYPAAFYRRARVFPKLGFDEFRDIRFFAGMPRFGPYISDAAMTEKVAEALREASGPVFVFAITMENHGPLHFERAGPEDAEALYAVPPPEGCNDLTVYLRHIRNADRMVSALRECLQGCGAPAGLCWYGDHVPIMPTVYETLGEPGGAVEYAFWSNGAARPPDRRDIPAHELALNWLRAMGIVG